jgi:hypothetical protein
MNWRGKRFIWYKVYWVQTSSEKRNENHFSVRFSYSDGSSKRIQSVNCFRLLPARSTHSVSACRFWPLPKFCFNQLALHASWIRKLSGPSVGMNLCPLKSWQSGTDSQVNSTYSHRSQSNVVSDLTAFHSPIALSPCWYSLMLHFQPSELLLIYEQHVMIVIISRSSWQRDGLHQSVFSLFHD